MTVNERRPDDGVSPKVSEHDSSRPPLSGREFRELLFGSEAVARHMLGATEALAPELTRVTDEANFGVIWQLPGLSVRDRRLVTITALAVLGREGELAAHIRGALRDGVRQTELVQAIVQLTFYTGIPTVHAALRVAREAFADSDVPADQKGAGPTPPHTSSEPESNRSET